ncbi:MAG: hypothetical protein KDB07_03860, partial [Planctomycetes bacterium]|nr:hypothetical protein [Planctomycetota bacterium]
MASISYDEFMRQVESGDFKPLPVIAVAGGEAYLRRDALETLKAELRARSIEIEPFDDETRNDEELLAILRSGSLFGGGSAVLLNSVRVGNRRESIVRFKDRLLEYFERPSKSNVLLINGESWAGNLAVPRKVKAEFLVIECPEFAPWQSTEVERVITSIARRQDLKLASGVAGELREICGGDLGACARELEKLALIVEGRALTSEDLAAHLRYRGDDVSFALVDAIVFGERRHAIELAGSFVGERDSGNLLRFMGLLESNLRKLAILS